MVSYYYDLLHTGRVNKIAWGDPVEVSMFLLRFELYL